MAVILGWLLNKIKKMETILIISILLFIIIIISVQVVMRYFFQNPFTWPEELSSLMLIYLCFFSADVIYKDKGHISIDYFVNLFPDKLKKFIAIFVNLLIGVFLGIIFVKSIRLFVDQYSITIAASLKLPKSFWVFPVTLTFPSMLLSSIYYVLIEFGKKEIDKI
jgi:TRAP-type C4-dicarboxylate transport system permease small subunit